MRAWWRGDRKKGAEPLTLDTLRALFERVEKSDFLTGRATGWKGGGFDWVIKPANRQKILEGNYDNRDGGRFDGIVT